MKINSPPLLSQLGIKQLWLFSLFLSIVFAELIVTIMELLLKGEVTADYLLTGLVASILTTCWVFFLLDVRLNEVTNIRLQLEATLNAIPDLLFEVDAKGYIHDYHAPHPEILFAPPEHFLGKSLATVLPADVADVCLSALHEALQQGWSIGKEYSIKLAEEMRWFELSVALKEPNRDKQEARLIVVSRDITQLKKNQLALQHAAERLEKIASRVPGMVYQFQLTADGNYCFPYSSPAIYDIFRITPEEARDSAEKTFTAIHPDDHQELINSIEESTQQLTAWQHEFRVRFDDGTERWLYGNSLPQREADGSTLWHGFITDITERKKIERTHAFLSQSVHQHSDERFFDSLARYLAKCLEMEFVCIDYLEGDGLMAETLSVYHDGEFEDNVRYALKDTPCGDVVGNDICCFPASVCQFFPKDEVLKTLNAESYIGTTLWSATGKAIGLIAVIGEKPLANRVLAESILKIVATRAAGELERLCIEKELKESEMRFRLAFDDANVGMCLVDTTGKLFKVNRQICEMFGYSKSEMETMNVNDIAHPDYINVSKNFIQATKTSKTDYAEFEKVYIHKQGQLVYGLVSSSLVRNEQGEPLYFISHVLDITQRKQAEKELQESEQKLKAIFDILGVGISITNEQGHIIDCNKASEVLLSISRQEHLSRNYADKTWQIIRPDFTQMLPEELPAALALKNNTTVSSVEMGIVKADGIVTWLLVSATPIGISGYGVAIAYMDITERKYAETELRIAATVFESQEGMMITDTNGIIIKVNQSFSKITGYNESEAIGQTPRLLRSGKHDAAFYEAIWQSIYDTGTWQGEIWNRRKNGECYPQWLTITAVATNNDNVISHYVATLTDISERKAAEETIKQLAFYDALTNLPNRRLLYERFQHSIDACYRTGKQLAVLMMDLDHFKEVNDSLGHAAGDELLQQVAERITGRLRATDTVARLGGDEFVILIEEVKHPEDIARVAEALIFKLSQPFTLCENHEVTIGASIGIAIHPEHGDSIEKLMDNADTALYQAKDKGRGCFVYFSKAG